MRNSTLFALLPALVLATSPAWADDPASSASAPSQPGASAGPAAPPPPDVARDEELGRPNLPERGFIFVVEPSVPEQWHAVVTAGMGNVTNSGEERPIGAGPIIPTFGAELGIWQSRVSAFVDGGVISVNQGARDLPSAFLLETGAQILLTDPTSRTWRLSLRPSYFHDVDNSSTASLTGTLAWYHKGFRAITSLNASHTFQSDADIADLQYTLGATYELPLGFRVGVEGVVSDLEEIGCTLDSGASGCGAEDGSSAFAGPTAGWNWDRFQVVLGPAWGITPRAGGTTSAGLQNPQDSLLFRGALAIRL